MTDRFDRRLRACRDRLEDADADVDADCVVLFPSPNLTYATGFDESPSERHLLLFVPRTGEPAFVAPTLYGDQLRETSIDDVRLWADDDDPLALVDEVLTERGVDETDDSHILVDDTMWATFTQDLRSVRPNATFGLASAVFEPLRIRKDQTELEALRRAGTLADRVALEIRERGEEIVGLTEAELATEIDRLLGVYGGSGRGDGGRGGPGGDGGSGKTEAGEGIEGKTNGGEPAFTTIVASGPNGARPHHHSGDRVISPGDPVVLDFGAFVTADLESGTGRYPGDQTRTVVFDGEPSEEFQRVHDVVREAQQAAVEAVEPGVTASAVDRAARTVIEDAGYGDAFTHRTGHGVGLEVHEPPYIVAGNDRELESGMVFSVEPGVYLEGEFGVRIEDLVVVTDDGPERLNETPRGW
ncbi:aminopeptidase P family protein [Halobacteria archaeon AArc-m2/3/4]|uniref:Aminopeptidase P family protein n=1 Tax=Natronoglomus mannanivorans TaxID=2979990 RepID=A0AAP3E2M8_9EURY|nr:aminopeptidase P family protein [Halobacteria archaeon AArc-xg1-1]MCU4974242.1 aminopeptidase P family protein [Halobacteria archaeon AArc-m2/3/4]